MTRAKMLLGKWGLHSFLLPVFFIIHTYKQYYGLVSTVTAVTVMFEVFLYISFIFLILVTVTKHVNKSLLLTTFLGFILLFFGVIKDFIDLTLHFHLLAKYSVLIPFLSIITVSLITRILQKNHFFKVNLFLTVLLLIFILIDGLGLLFLNKSEFLAKNLLINKRYSALISAPESLNKPDIYYLVFDSYPGTSFLKKVMNYDNSQFNNQLLEKGLQIINNPKSNYNRTAFSIASTLNFSYLKDIDVKRSISAKEYAEANLTIKESIVPQILKQNNYTFYNLSVFDISTSPAIRRETFLTMPERNILLYNTLLERLKNDLFWNLLVGKHSIRSIKNYFEKDKSEIQKALVEKDKFNKLIVDSLLKIPAHKISSHKFVYAHLYLPHPPFFYDENGTRNDLNYIMTEESLENKDLFLSYLKYTNKIILEIINTIKRDSVNQPVIILQSDHGFRDFKGWADHPECFFQNFSAFYFPDKNYSTLYDTLSNINTFPIIFNKYFKSTIPLQKDSSFLLPN